jgi:hypothetical protein
MDILTVPLNGVEVYRYVRELLSWEDLLSASLRQLAIEEGSCSVFIPSGRPLPGASEIRGEHPAFTGCSWACKWRAADFISDYVGGNENRVALFASAAMEGDLCLSKFSTPYALIPTVGPQSAVFPYIDSPRAEAGDVVAALSESRAFTAFAVLTSAVGNGGPLHPAKQLLDSDIFAFSTRTEHLVLDAFDGGSYLVWTALKRVNPG